MKQKNQNNEEKNSTTKKYYATGKEHHKTKQWDLYQAGKFIGTYYGLAALCSTSGHSPMRAWQMANGYNGNRKKDCPITCTNGFTILRHGEEYGWWINDKK